MEYTEKWCAMFKSLRVVFFNRNINIIYNSYHPTTLTWHRLLKSFHVQGKDLSRLLSQYHGCWWPGDTRSQVITDNGIDLVEPNSVPACWGLMSLITATHDPLHHHPTPYKNTKNIPKELISIFYIYSHSNTYIYSHFMFFLLPAEC